MLVPLRKVLPAVTFVLGMLLPVAAQVHGVPASVSSFGFGGSRTFAPGVPASVTSLGPRGYGNNPGFPAFFNPFFNTNTAFLNNLNTQFPVFNQPPGIPQHPGPPLHDGRFHFHGFKNGFFNAGFFPGLYGGYYYPVQYGAGYNTPVIIVQNGGGDGDYDYSYDENGNLVVAPEHREKRKETREVAAAPEPPPPAETAEPLQVTPQPKTTLVYKDGHKAQVQNYAIIGDSLIDLSDGRTKKIPLDNLDLTATQKINDDDGIDFRVPAKPKKHTN